MKSTTFETGMSDFHELTTTISQKRWAKEMSKGVSIKLLTRTRSRRLTLKTIDYS